MVRCRFVLTSIFALAALGLVALAENEFTGAKCENLNCKDLCYGDRVSDLNQCPNSKLCRLVKCTKGTVKSLLCKRTGQTADKCSIKIDTVQHDCTTCKSYNCGCSETDGDCAFASCNCNDGGIDIINLLQGATCVQN
jgi:hypothetical protein